MTFCHFKHFCACAHYSELYIKNFQTNPNQKSFSQLIHIVFYGIGKKLQHVLKENFLYSVAWIFALGNQANFLFEPYWNFFALPRILFNRKTFFNTRALTVLKQKIPTQIPNHTYHFLYHSTKKKHSERFPTTHVDFYCSRKGCLFVHNLAVINAALRRPIWARCLFGDCWRATTFDDRLRLIGVDGLFVWVVGVVCLVWGLVRVWIVWCEVELWVGLFGFEFSDWNFVFWYSWVEFLFFFDVLNLTLLIFWIGNLKVGVYIFEFWFS